MFRSMPVVPAYQGPAISDPHAKPTIEKQRARQARKPGKRRHRLNYGRQKWRDKKGWTVVEVKEAPCVTRAREFFLKCQKHDKKKARQTKAG